MQLALEAPQCCRLCAIGHSQSNLADFDQPWLVGEEYFSFVSLGALVPGWSLVAPKRHVLNLSNDYQRDEFWYFADRAVDVVHRKYGQSVVFEHGSQEQLSATSCGTAHAHLHIVPLSFDLAERARQFDSSLVWEACAASVIAEHARGREYLFIANRYRSEQTDGLITFLEKGQSQYFRKVIAAELGRSMEFDYKTHPQIAIVRESATILSGAVKRSLVSAA